ncbi:7-deoxyloganetic acid glucosyltransferase-like [Cucurbita pepo subsp. pepo]|uniref:7-deoxyloganetic acid glucosyltransferase-like n=1 Tax=Cucurbita pepo subsp. pepo TaxID=3664 RepID=UPI000C9D9507|nr:7-deoxyloganetic acid glucosyltransferase-like [Cucurbita pepo subsp. pepo]
MEGESHTQIPHVLIFPLPFQGHINPMLKLAELLSLAGITVTFLNTPHSHRHLTLHSDVLSRFSRFPAFRFLTITDGLPPDHPRTFDYCADFITSFETVTKPILRDFLVSGHFGSDLTCVILDGFFKFLVDADDAEIKIPIFGFRLLSACSVWTYFCVHDLIQDGQLPIRGEEDMDRVLTNVPGMENVLRCRDLPSACRVTDMNDSVLQFNIKQTQRSSEFHSVIFNSFEDLEGPILEKIRTLCPNLYAIGPLHALLKAKLPNETECLNNLWEVDRSCLKWLDNQPAGSVIYVSFGSITVMGREQFMEFWHGLVESGRNFLWVIRPDLVRGKNGDVEIPAELEEGTRKRGYTVGWAPQEEVLAHEAVGGFLTHSGWNSTLESVVAGKPMICWSYISDQLVNSRFVSNVWKLGLDMKDVCDRGTVAKMVNELLVDPKEEFMRSAAEMANLAKRSVSPGGSSYADFDRLVQDIRLLSQ